MRGMWEASFVISAVSLFVVPTLLLLGGYYLYAAIFAVALAIHTIAIRVYANGVNNLHKLPNNTRTIWKSTPQKNPKQHMPLKNKIFNHLMKLRTLDQMITHYRMMKKSIKTQSSIKWS